MGAVGVLVAVLDGSLLCGCLCRVLGGCWVRLCSLALGWGVCVAY